MMRSRCCSGRWAGQFVLLMVIASLPMWLLALRLPRCEDCAARFGAINGGVLRGAVDRVLAREGDRQFLVCWG